MKTIAFVVSWLALAVGIMLVVGGVFRVQVREADDGYGDQIDAAVDRYFNDPEARPPLRLGNQHLVIGAGIVVISLPGSLLSLRRRGS